MIKIQRNMLVGVMVIAVCLTFYISYNNALDEFEYEGSSKKLLLGEHIEISSNFINNVAMHSTMYLEQKAGEDSELYHLLKYDPQRNTYNLDGIVGTDKEKLAGNLTGIGHIPDTGIDREELNLALYLNGFFSDFYDKFPDIAWLYYTSENNYINIYPWVSSKDFIYSEKLKSVDFYKDALPANNPGRDSIWTSAYLDEAGKGLMVTLSKPIYLEDSFKGVVSLDLTDVWLSKIIASNYESYLVDDTDIILAQSSGNAAAAVQKLDATLLNKGINVGRLKKLEDGRTQKLGGYYVYSDSFRSAPWKLFLLIPVWLVAAKSAVNTIPILLICALLLWSLNQVNQRKKNEELLQHERDFMSTTLLSLIEAIIVVDHSGRITLMNKVAEEFTGWTLKAAYGQEYSKIVANYSLVKNEKAPDPVKMVLASGKSISFTKFTELLSKDGNRIYIEGSCSPIISGSDTPKGAVVSFRDITKEYEQEKQIEAFLEVNLDMLCVSDLDGNFHRVNKKFEEIMGYSAEELEGRSFLDYVHEDDKKATLEAIQNLSEKEANSRFINRYLTRDGEYRYIEWHAQPSIGKYTYLSARDITENVMREEKLENLAIKDQLTGVYNRHFFDAIIDREMELSDQNHRPLSMILIDLDHFKKVNDTWGHPEGDEVLKQTARIVSDTIRVSDLLIRFGGEEFIILLPSTTIEGAAAAAEKVRSRIENHIHPVCGKQTASFGVAEKLQGEEFASLYHRLDKALYQAKQGGRNRVVSL
ncbi:MAG: diguanylate cyclase [Pseudomonadota bacterium]